MPQIIVLPNEELCPEGAAFEAQVQALKTTSQGTDKDSITQAVEALNHATENFAGRRMDASIKQAFAGQDLNKLEL